nr:vomeronasal type-1 receptor 4-like [Camelus dromedarius]
MATKQLAIGVVISLQTIAGLLGNFCLVYHFLFLYFTGGRFRSTDLILKHLASANLLLLLSKGIPDTLTAFGLKIFFSDVGCKFIFYIHRMGRDVSMGTTCILSIFQVIMISPSGSRLAELKVKAPRYMGISNILCWILTMMLNILVPFHITNRINNTITLNNIDHGYCYAVNCHKITKSLFVSMILLHDGIHLVLMVWASGSMVFILHRHRQRVQYVHRNNQSPRPSPETAATQSILVMMCFFISLWTLSCALHICLAVFNNPSFWLKNTATLITACFPAVSPYILMTHDSRVPRVCFH